jgi:hypothetical protein
MAAFEEMQEGPAVSINFTMGSPAEHLSHWEHHSHAKSQDRLPQMNAESADQNW